MRQSFYLFLATACIKADIHLELRKVKRQQRAVHYAHPHLSPHLLRDIGLQADGIDNGEKFPAPLKAKRVTRYLRHLYYGKITT